MNNQPPASILVVDDIPENLHILIELLQAQGYKVYAAPNGMRALASVRENPPDLILLDIRMPEMDGYEVCKRIKAHEGTTDIPILFISGLHDVDDKVKGFTAGGVDYITKPFQAEEVLARVKTHLALRALQQRMQHELAWHRQAEKELRALNQQLHAANASKDKFFSILAHDLRNPFTTLLGLTEALVEDFNHYDTAKLQSLLAQLHESSKQVYALLTNLLEWSRLQRGLIDCQPTVFTISTVIQNITRLVDTVARQKQITLRSLVPEDQTGYADKYMVRTILRNLLTNAIKFTHPGGTVEISVQPRQHEIDITVADTGIGMSEETIATLFRIDVKASQRGTMGEKGTGLGLILCKELAEKTGGRIRVESQVGHGSRFIVSLPAHA